MPVKPGDTFIGDPRELPAPVGHLWVVVEVYESDSAFCALAVMVEVTSWVQNADPSCILRRGDHPFIFHQSFVYYQQAAEVEVEKLSALKPHAPVSAELLTRIRQGLHRSKFAKRGLKRIVPQT